MPGRIISRFVLPLSILAFAAACSDSPTEPPTNDDVAVLAFDGINDYVRVPDAPALDLTDEVTLTAWVYVAGDMAGEPGIIQKDGPGSWGRYGMWLLDGRVDFCIYIDGASQSCILSDGTLTANAWNHVAGVYDGNEMRVYINGELDSSELLTGAISTSIEPLYIGGDPTESAFTNGHIHEVQVWSHARSPAQIAAGVHTRPSGTEAELVAYWRMDEGTGQVVNDASASGFHGVLGAGPSVDGADPVWSTAPWPHR